MANAFQAQLPPYIEFPPHLATGAYRWQAPDNGKALAADTAVKVYNAVRVAGIAGAGQPTDRLMEKIIIQNNSTLPLKVCVNQDVSAGAWHFILAGGSAANDGLGGTYIFYPRLEGIETISVMSVGGAGAIAITKVGCVQHIS